MGLATIDPHSLKVQTKLFKVLKFAVNQVVLTEIQPLENVQISYDYPDAVRHSVRMAILGHSEMAVSQSKLA